MKTTPANMIADEASFRCDALSVHPLQGGFFLDTGPEKAGEWLSKDCAQSLALWLLMRSGAQISSVEAVAGNIRVRFRNGKRSDE